MGVQIGRDTRFGDVVKMNITDSAVTHDVHREKFGCTVLFDFQVLPKGKALKLLVAEKDSSTLQVHILI